MTDPDVGALAAQVLELSTEAPRTVVLIDGGSGAGKTSLARDLVDALPGEPTLVSLDRAYPGWSGLAAASLMVPGMITGEQPGHPTWHWQRGETDGWVDLPTQGVLVIEGCGALTPTTRALASAAIWCDLAAATRRDRALARDGDGFRPWWRHWAAQEAEHWRAHRPRSLADIVLDMA